MTNLEAVILVQADIAEVSDIDEAVHGATEEAARVLRVVQHLHNKTEGLSDIARIPSFLKTLDQGDWLRAMELCMQNLRIAGHDFVTVRSGPTLRHASPMLDITSRSTHPGQFLCAAWPKKASLAWQFVFAMSMASCIDVADACKCVHLMVGSPA